MVSRRVERVAKAIKEEVSKIIQEEVKDPRIGFITVTDVELSDDLRHAKVFVSVYGNESEKGKEKEKALRGLSSAAGFIRKEIGQRIKLRYTPEIVFKWDRSVERGAHIEELLKGIRQENNE